LKWLRKSRATNFTALSRVLHEKLISHSTSQEIPRFSWNPKAHYMLTRARHRFLSWARWIQSTPSHPVSLRSIVTISSHLRPVLSRCLLPSGFPTYTLYEFPISSMHSTWPARLILLDLITLIILGEAYKLCSLLQPLDTHPSQFQIFSSVPCSHISSKILILHGSFHKARKMNTYWGYRIWLSVSPHVSPSERPRNDLRLLVTKCIRVRLHVRLTIKAWVNLIKQTLPAVVRDVIWVSEWGVWNAECTLHYITPHTTFHCL
jgi:hypothetical protein